VPTERPAGAIPLNSTAGDGFKVRSGRRGGGSAGLLNSSILKRRVVETAQHGAINITTGPLS
jgi:hypothetical protein